MSEWQPEQLEKLAEIGMQLRKQRQEQGYTIKQVETKTYIRGNILEALEAGDPTELPEPVYAQGLLRRYADAIGLSGGEVASTFPVSDRHVLAENRVNKVLMAPKRFLPKKTLKKIQLNPKIGFTPTRRLSSETIAKFAKPIAGGAIAIVLSVGAFFLWQAYRSQRESLAENTSAAEAETQPTAAEGSQITPSPSPSPSPASSRTPERNSVTIRLQGSSYLEVTVDGEVKFEGTLEEGEERTWQPKEEIKLFAGNAGAVLLSANGETPKPIGAEGENKTLTIPTEQ